MLTLVAQPIKTSQTMTNAAAKTTTPTSRPSFLAALLRTLSAFAV